MVLARPVTGVHLRYGLMFVHLKPMFWPSTDRGNMDLNTVGCIVRPHHHREFSGWQQGDAILAGGTWLLSEPQPSVRRLISLDRMGWKAIEVGDGELQISATCTIAQLAAFEAPVSWTAASLFGSCCEALLGSFKIWTMATVGGNLCLALPAGPMVALIVALDGTCTIWAPEGTRRSINAIDFVVGPQRCALLPGEVLRSVQLPAEALCCRPAFRQISLTPHGRSAALLIGTRLGKTFRLTITGSVQRPIRLDFAAVPTRNALRDRIEGAIEPESYYDDVHGRPAWRRDMTLELAEEIRLELACDA